MLNFIKQILFSDSELTQGQKDALIELDISYHDQIRSYHASIANRSPYTDLSWTDNVLFDLRRQRFYAEKHIRDNPQLFISGDINS